MYNIIQKRKIWLGISIFLVILSIIALSVWGLKPSIDFTGGSLLELEFSVDRPTNEQISSKLADLNLESLTVQPIGDKGVLIRTQTVTEDQHQQILKKINELTGVSAEEQKAADQEKIKNALGLSGEGLEGMTIDFGEGSKESDAAKQILGATELNGFTELRFDSIGPTIGKELQRKTLYAIVIVIFAIAAYIAYAFRKVSKPVESWKYGVAAILALTHDVLVVVGVFAVLGHFYNVQIDSLFVTALLTLLGFSIHDTIVTFDRIRENLHRHQDKTFEDIINLSINETIVRSLNTSITILLVLIATLLFGGKTIHYFILALLIGIFIGTYSSIFVASPLLMIFYKLKKY